ncbi:MAG: DUF4101 domain-containing protein [Cyanobacteria bacterium SZAS LIN-2]|nr:DUF4101 domain-containing protein [Cyanobacteria bacterium SZAS LIN-2]
MNTFGIPAAWAAPSKKQLAEVDYNAGADPAGYQPQESKSGTRGQSKETDLEQSDGGSAAADTTGSGSANPNPSAAGGAHEDGSVDSIWSEAPPVESKSKSKKKTKDKSRSPVRKKSSDKVNAGADAGATGDEAGASSAVGSGTTADTAPSASTSTSTSTATEPAPDTSKPSDFGSFPATRSTSTGGRSVLDQPVTTTIFGRPAPDTTNAAGDNKGSQSSPATTASSEPATPVDTTATEKASPAKASASGAGKKKSPKSTGSTTAANKKPKTTTPDTPSQTATETESPAPAATPTTSTSAAAVTSTPDPTPSSTTTTAATTTVPVSRMTELSQASLCSTRTFFQSDLIRTVSWPGVGPFKGDSDPNDLADPQDNKLTLKTDGDKLSSAELFLIHQPGNPQGFINLQMVMDFMLEAVGTKDKRINDFNAFLEKNREKIVKRLATEEKPLLTSSGPYLISIASSGNSSESNYLVQLKSKNAESGSTAESGAETQVESGAGKSTSNSTKTTGSVSTTSTGTGKSGKTGTAGGATSLTLAGHNNATTTAIANANPYKKPPTTSQSSAAPVVTDGQPAPTGKQPAPAASQSSNDSLKQEFIETIRNWQTIKKAAVRNCDASELSKVLTGKALDKQTVAIGWLTKKKDYYELTPKGVSVDRYEEISQSPRRYAVFAQVKEFSRLMDQTTNKMLSESEDSYKVKYTIEKTGDHWSIYDSDLIKNSQAAGDQSKAGTKPKR